MQWSDEVILKSYTYAENDIGDSIKTKSERKVYANKKSVTRTEFYQAVAVSLHPEIIFEVMTIDYENEKLLSYGSIEYNILRTYSANFEQTDLICVLASTEQRGW